MFPSYHPHGAEQAPRLTRVAVLASLSAPLPCGHTPHRAGRSSRRRLETPRCSVLTVAALATAQAQLALSMERSEHLKLQRLLDHEKAAAAAAKAREKEARQALREMGGDANAGGGGGAELRASGSEVGGGGATAQEVQAAQAAQQDAQER